MESVVSKIPSAKELGLGLKRGERLSAQESRKQIVEEAERLGTLKEIKIDENRSILIFSTVAASPHTPFTIPYQNFEKEWRLFGQEVGYTPPSNTDLIVLSKSKEEARVPLHIINWMMVKKRDEEGNILYEEVDFFDLVGVESRYDKDRPSTFSNLSPEKFERLKKEVWKEMERRMVNHSKFLKQLYKTYVLPEITQAINKTDISESLREKIISKITSLYIDNTFGVGYYGKRDEDGLGRGPQSNPLFHWHNVIYAYPEKIWEAIIEEDKDKEKNYEIFKQVVEAINKTQVVSGGLEFKNIADETYFKQVDPYSFLFFKAAKGWLLDKLKGKLKSRGVDPIKLNSFTHHTNPFRIDLRYAEGIRVEIPKSAESLGKFLLAFSDFSCNLYEVYGNIKEGLESYWRESDINTLDQLFRESDFPPELTALIKRIAPTELQKEKLDIQDLDYQIPSGKSRLSKFAKKELESKHPAGYNIPGVPSFGITFEIRENSIVIRISPLLSKKGVGEQAGGIPMEREQA